MAKITIALGVLLMIVAVAAFAATGSEHPTSLIPGGIGLLFVVFGLLANSQDPKRRMLWMHISVTVGLLVFLGLVPGVIDAVRLMRGVSFPHPIAIEEKAATSMLCLVYVILCVRSFVAARRGRTLAGAV